MLIKSRVAKMSERGLYLQDRQLQKTQFQPGARFKYVMDLEHRKMVILPANEGNNTVSKRVHPDRVNPVIDIRNKEALAAFDGCTHLQVEIHDDQVIVSGYVEEQKETLASRVKRAITSVTNRRSKIADIADFLKVRKTAEVVMRKGDFKKVVGGWEQLPLFSFDELGGSEQASSIATALQNLFIPLQAASLFSGAGFMDVGFLKAGFDIVFALEKNHDAAETYRFNIGDHMVEADITQFMKSLIPNVPVVFGGSPCQGFSNSNRYTNFLDNPNNFLVRQYIESVKAVPDCKVFILENVPQILTSGSGQFKEEIMNELSEFEITCGILNAADYGSPQTRKRAIFIGSKIGRIDLPEPVVESDAYTTVREALSGVHNGLPNQLDVSNAKDITLQRIQSVPPGGNVHDIPEHIRPKGQHSDMYKRLEWDRPAVTIVNPRKAMLLHPEEHRILSVRECGRIQGVDDDFIFQGSLGSKQQQVANGVPVHLAKAVATVVKNAILQFNIRNRKASFAL